jgi:hypothetical protein
MHERPEHQAPDAVAQHSQGDGHRAIADGGADGFDGHLPPEIQAPSQQRSRNHRGAADRELQGQRAQNRCDVGVALSAAANGATIAIPAAIATPSTVENVNATPMCRSVRSARCTTALPMPRSQSGRAAPITTNASAVTPKSAGVSSRARAMAKPICEIAPTAAPVNPIGRRARPDRSGWPHLREEVRRAREEVRGSPGRALLPCSGWPVCPQRNLIRLNMRRD